jgi:hypothetical protein
MGLPGVRPQSTALPPPGRLNGSLPARNPLGLPPPSATGAGTGQSNGVMTFSVESGTQEDPPQESPGRVPFSVGANPGGMPRPMGGGAPSPLNPMGSPRPMSMNYGRSPLGDSAPPQEDNQSNRPPSGGGLTTAPSGGL